MINYVFFYKWVGGFRPMYEGERPRRNFKIEFTALSDEEAKEKVREMVEGLPVKHGTFRRELVPIRLLKEVELPEMEQLD